MKKSHWSVTDYLAMSIAVTAILAALSAIYPGWSEVWELVSGSNAASWAQAISGLGAVIVSLYLANRSDRAARAAEFDKARIVAANLFFDVVHFNKSLKDLYKIEIDASQLKKLQKLREMLVACKDAPEIFTQEITLQLAPFPEHCGYRLAFGVQTIAFVKKLVSEHGLDDPFPGFTDKESEMLEKCLNFAATAHLSFQVARRVIQREVGYIFDDGLENELDDGSSPRT